MKEVVITGSSDTVTVGIGCEIDHHTAKMIREIADAQLIERRPKVLVLDFSGVSFMDSSGIGLILGRLAKAEEIGARVEVVGLCANLLRLVRMSGIEKQRGITVK